MKIENEVLYINKIDLDHILGYLEFDITEREKYINETGKNLKDFVLSENFLNGVEIELSMNGLEDKTFRDIAIKNIWGE